MRKSFLFIICAFVFAMDVSAQSVKRENPGSDTNYRPIVLCRRKGCTQISDRMTRSYLFNTFANLMLVNDKTKAFLCEADPITRACLANEIKYALNVGGAAGIISIPSVTITEVTFSKNLSRITFMLHYDLYLNGLKSFCSTSYNAMDVNDRRQVIVRDNQYRCQFTADMPSHVSTMFNVDYVDLDYGIIGAYYSTGITGDSSGGSSGYVLFKLQYADIGTNQVNQRDDFGCGTRGCENEPEWMIPPGQYEVLPYIEKKRE